MEWVESRCSSGTSLIFIWWPDTTAPAAGAIDEATARFEAMLRRPDLLWTPWTTALARQQFRARLVLACSGGLHPVDHVKPISRARGEHLFEIRWDIDVTRRLPDGGREFGQIPVRLYHAEPASLPFHFIGLHLHEKFVAGEPEEVRSLQNAEIDVAVARFEEGRPQTWGV